MNALMTLNIGFAPYSFFTIKTFKNYCYKHHLDFIEIKDLKISHLPVFEKFRILEYLDTYTQVLFLDLDFLIKKNSPNIFELTRDLSYFYCVQDVGPATWATRHYHPNDLDLLQKLYGRIPKQPENMKYFNAGMFVMSKQQRGLYQKILIQENLNKNRFDDWAEQNLLNYLIESIPIPSFYLGQEWNFLRHHQTEGFEKSYFIHYAGKRDERLNNIKRDYLSGI